MLRRISSPIEGGVSTSVFAPRLKRGPQADAGRHHFGRYPGTSSHCRASQKRDFIQENQAIR